MVLRATGKTTTTAVTGARTAGFKAGRYHALEGTIVRDNAANPAGAYLELRRPIVVGGVATRRVFLDKDAPYSVGSELKLNGRLDLQAVPGNPASVVVAMTGRTNLSAGEPRFDGKSFFNASGAKLKTFPFGFSTTSSGPAGSLPSFVVDSKNKTAFIAFMDTPPTPAGVNPFLGVQRREVRPTNEPVVIKHINRPPPYSGDALVAPRTKWPMQQYCPQPTSKHSPSPMGSEFYLEAVWPHHNVEQVHLLYHRTGRTFDYAIVLDQGDHAIGPPGTYDPWGPQSGPGVDSFQPNR